MHRTGEDTESRTCSERLQINDNVKNMYELNIRQYRRAEVVTTIIISISLTTTMFI